jgi:hypothetical protein
MAVPMPRPAWSGMHGVEADLAEAGRRVEREGGEADDLGAAHRDDEVTPGLRLAEFVQQRRLFLIGAGEGRGGDALPQ